MKKSLLAVAVLAAASAASAQSSVTVFGVVDATLTHGSGSVSSRTQLANSGYNGSRLGFRGSEALGGGMTAAFWLEAGLANDNGSGALTNTNNQANGATGGGGLTFNRRSTVSLTGGWGEVRLGRDYTPQFLNLAGFDPFGTSGVGTTQAALGAAALVPGGSTGTAVRASNSIGYFLPAKLGGFYGQVQYYLGENPGNTTGADDGRGAGVRLGFANGPFNLALALSRTEFAAGNVRQNNLGAQWNFGIAKLQGQYTRDRAGSLDGRGFLLGALAPVGVGEIRASYSGYKTSAAGTPQTRKIALGYVHHLSKRTALYATWAHAKNRGGARHALNGAATAADGSSRGYDFGLRHSF